MKINKEMTPVITLATGVMISTLHCPHTSENIVTHKYNFVATVYQARSSVTADK
jgi:hypothetical protein